MIKNLNMDCAQKMQRYQDYVEALEEERKKIQVFQRELPLCLELVTQAIEACRRELSGATTENVQAQSECSEQTMSECGPVLEEFIPIKRSSSCDEEDELESHKPEDNNTEKISKNSGSNIDKKKSDWLKSAQLWNQSSDPPSKEDHWPKKATVVEVKKTGGAFQPFHKEKPVLKNHGCDDQQPAPAAKAGGSTPAASSSTAETGGGIRDSDKGRQQQQPIQRKQRRCWSPELHRRFLHALQQLGGTHSATPKQIRELMKVDGLTNDEVKSHLQKYRLHSRRPSPTVHNNSNPQQPQFVVVGGIWVPPPPEYSAIAPTTPTPAPADAATRIYTPLAATPPPPSSQSPKPSESGQFHSEERSGRCNSPATSSSTHTNTASPVS